MKTSARIRWGAGAALVALVLSACGGSGGTSASSGDRSRGPAQRGGDAGEVDVAQIADLSTIEFPAARRAADLALEQLGDGALDAVVAAIGKGYSSSQIVGAIGAGTLRADGSIEGAAPDREASVDLRLARSSPRATTSDGAATIVLAAAPAGTGQTVRDAMLEWGRGIDPNNAEKGAIAWIIAAQSVGYAPGQIAEILSRPDTYVIRAATGMFPAYDSVRRRTVEVELSCTLVFDTATGNAFLPEFRSEDDDCRRIVYRLGEQAEREVFVDGGLTSGTIIAGDTITDVLVNELNFLLLPEDGLAVGDGTVTRRAVLPGPDDCEDRKISPLGFTFEGRFVDEEQTRLEGTFTYRVKAEEYVDEDPCEDTLTSWGTGGGSWTAEWSAEDGVLRGELTVASGSFGTNEFELRTAG